MTRPQIIKSSSGEEMVVMPLTEYEALIEAAEDADDIRAAIEARARIETGESEFIPFDFAVRIIAGEHPIRVWREYRGLKVGELAKTAGISQAYLSQIEGAKRKGSLSTMRALARALRVDLDDLLPPED